MSIKSKYTDTKCWRMSGSVSVSVNKKFANGGENGNVIEYAPPTSSTTTKNIYLRTSSLDIYESISYKNLKQRKSYNKLLLGEERIATVGQEIASSSNGQVNLTARPPSWTQHHAGLNHSFVLQALSSSQHEVQNLNAFKSGTVPYEISPVPYSGSMFYTKKNSLVKYTASVTASAAIGEAFDAVSGSRMPQDNPPDYPYEIDIPVMQHGKIVDLKVWVEIVQSSGTTGADSLFGPLSRLGVAIRSPNVKFDYSRPIMNDQTIVKTLADTNFGFFKNSYLLWVGAELDNLIFTVSDQSVLDYYTWNKDRHMRTIFYDGAPELAGYNPRNLASSHGDFFAELTSSGPASNYAGNSPNGSRIDGNDFPWMTDARIQDGGPGGAAGSPPTGWLTGPGGVTGSNEWPTTGSNLGPAMMRPHYPMLDTVFEQKTVETVIREKTYGYLASSTAGRDVNINKRKGYRPGLRGTEAYGTWKLLLVTAGDYLTFSAKKSWFRQVRLEFTLDTGQDVSRVLPRKKGVTVSKKIKPYAILSGSKFGVNWTEGFYGPTTDKFRNIVYTVPDYEYHSTIGIVDNTASNNTDFAVFSRITGPLADFYSASDKAHARYMFLNNEFGTPYIPLSSGSGEVMSSQIYSINNLNTKLLISKILEPQLAIGTAQTLSTTLSKTKPAMLTRDRITYFTLSGSE